MSFNPTSENSAHPMIEFRGVSKEYGRGSAPAVRNLNLTVGRGELLTLVGPSGCGKTTSLKMINRLIEPTSGEIMVDGRNLRDLKAVDLRRHIGYVIQHVGLFPHMSVAGNIAVVPKILGWKKDRIGQRIEEVLTLVDLDPAEFAGRRPRDLSGGQQQRVGVARALAADPAIVLMDEPFGATDPQTRQALQLELIALQKKVAKTIVLVTHDVDEALKLGDRIAVFGPNAELKQISTPADLLNRPSTEWVQRFIGGSPVLRHLQLQHFGDVKLLAPVDMVGGQVSFGGMSLITEDGRPICWQGAGKVPIVATMPVGTNLADAVGRMLRQPHVPIVVVDDEGRYLGIADIQLISSTLAEGDLDGTSDAPGRVAGDD
ncbi:MAG: ABC transporter ATP-binding protein [Nocardioides sp.]|uniref:ABC transporter ATP-binding protein n=1 Tax=Nocardioides sp. TaxID=35761 RepID=UPI0039E48BD9